jgi:hypothetical protein
MRTKTLLLTAVLGVAGAASTIAQAQSVYSANAVGYVNLSLPAGFSMISNPLNAATNDLQSLLTNVPNNTAIYTWSTTLESYAPSTFRSTTGKWTSDEVLNPGAGAFINLASATTITFVGNVPQGSLTNIIAPGFSIQSIPIPVSLTITSSTNALLNLPKPNVNDVIYQWVNATGYAPHTFRSSGIWTGTAYAPAVGESFFYFSTATTPTTWAVNFSVN